LVAEQDVVGGWAFGELRGRLPMVMFCAIILTNCANIRTQLKSAAQMELPPKKK